VNNYFEVRENDTPTKYVWNGNTRVARMTGPSTNSAAVQRLRVCSGFNLVSLTVTAPNALQQLNSQPSPVNQSKAVGQGEAITSAFKWDQPTESWQSVARTDTLEAGAVLWLKAATNAVLRLVGTPANPPSYTIPAGVSYQPAAVLGSGGLSTMAHLDLMAACFDPIAKSWKTRFPVPLAAQSDPLPSVSTESAVFLQADSPFNQLADASAASIRYYHQDHQGSTGSETGASGLERENTVFYPFGATRARISQAPAQGDYSFAQKETDMESGLDYFEARFYAANLSSFIIADRFACGVGRAESAVAGDTTLKERYIPNPQRWNPYAYGLRNPLKSLDPTGEDVVLLEPDDRDVSKGSKLGVTEGDRRLFSDAIKLLRGTEEGKRILKSLENVDVTFENAKSKGYGETTGHDVRPQILGLIPGSAKSKLNLRDIEATPKFTENLKVRLAAYTIYHELRRVEGFVKGDSKLQEALSEEKFPSSDPHEAAFGKEINVPLRSGNNGTFRLNPAVDYDSFFRLK